MANERFIYASKIPHPAEKVFAWHGRPGALERLIPPWSGASVVARRGEGVEAGSTVELRMPIGPFSVRWLAEHGSVIEGREFTDRQIRGPFSYWCHTHRITPDGAESSVLEDSIEYRVPGGVAGRLVAGGFIRSELERTFAYRHRVTAGDLDAHAGCDARPLAVAVTGSSGLVGSALVPFLRTGGHRVVEIGRSLGENRADCVRWDPARGDLDASRLAGVDAVVHLAGDNIAAGRWSAARKRAILASRVDGTRLLAEKLASMPTPPRTLIAASAIGFYGNRGDCALSERDGPGDGFLAEVCQAWEAAAEPARAAGIRVVSLRIGVVLAACGGALARMLLPFSIGAGGVVGSGGQYMSWVSRNDLVRLIHHAMLDASLAGPVNAVAPQAVTNREFTRVLARVLRRPAIVPVPGFAIRAALGEMADELLLASTRVEPVRLEESGFPFEHAGLESALRFELGRPQARR